MTLSDQGVSVRLRDAWRYVQDRKRFMGRYRRHRGPIYGGDWWDGRMYAVFGGGMQRPLFIWHEGKWYGAVLPDCESRYVRWMRAACKPRVFWIEPMSYEDMRYLLHHCELPPPPGIRKLLAVSPEP